MHASHGHDDTTRLRRAIASPGAWKAEVIAVACKVTRMPVQDFHARTLVVQPFDGNYGHAGFLIAVNGSPPRLLLTYIARYWSTCVWAPSFRRLTQCQPFDTGARGYLCLLLRDGLARYTPHASPLIIIGAGADARPSEPGAHEDDDDAPNQA